jgi:tetratricopeptide (TPR) repeat protein
MSSLQLTHLALTSDADAQTVRGALDQARRAYYEEPAGALAVAIRCYEIARSLPDAALCARARALQGAVSLHRGDLRSALDLVVDAERDAERGDDLVARVEVAALKGQVSFFTGSYAEALSHAERSVQLSDRSGDDDVRIYARRATCLVFGNVGVRDLEARVRDLLKLTIASGNRWEETISRNDLACYYQDTGDLAAAEREIDHAAGVAATVPPPHNFAMGLVYSTRADIRLLGGRPAEALADAERAIALLTANAEANPYVLGVTVRAEVQARMALGQLDDAQESGEGALAWLGDRVPQIRSLILSTLATELRAAGRIEAAYDALARSPSSSARPSASCPSSSSASSERRSRPAPPAGSQTSWRPRTANWPRPTRSWSCAPASSRACRSSCATRPIATGSPACTIVAISRVSSGAPHTTVWPPRSPWRCLTSITSSRSTTASAMPPATRFWSASPGFCSTSCARPTSWCAAAARSSWC